MIVNLLNKFRKNDIIFSKYEKISHYESYIISDDEKIRIKRCEFIDFEILCSECDEWFPIKKIAARHLEKLYLCKKCNHIGERNSMYGKHPTEEQRKKISERISGSNNPFFGKHHTDETKKKISNANKGRLVGEKNPMYGVDVYKKLEEEHGEEYVNLIKKKISENVSGSKNGFYGKHHTKETREKLSISMKNSEKHKAAAASKEVRQKISNGLKNSEKLKASRKSPEYREKRRLWRMEQILNAKLPGPGFNKKACKVFDIISEEKGIHIQHALNDGEFCVKELGFFLDGYDAENNIAYEYDEAHHFVGGKLKDEDIERQRKIEEVLHCTFIRLKDEDYDETGHKIIKEETTIQITVENETYKDNIDNKD